MSRYYILDGKTPVTADLITWAKWFDEDAREKRIVKQEEVNGVRVSTVFLGLNHSFGDGPPMIFETMVFGGSLEGLLERCSTWDEAEKQHLAMVERVKGETL